MKTKISEREHVLCVGLNKKAVQLNTKNILYLESQINYTFVHTLEGKYVFAKTLKKFESALDSRQFKRIHKSHIVNMSYITSIEINNNQREVLLKGGDKIKVSRRKVKEVVDFLANTTFN